MNDKMLILLQQLHIEEENYSSFNDAVLKKVIVDKKNNTWTFIIHNKTNFDLNTIRLFETKLKNAFTDIKNVDFVIKVDNMNDELIKDYYSYILKKLKSKLFLSTMFVDNLSIKDNKYIVNVFNKKEKEDITSIIQDINNYFNKYGFDINLEIIINKDNKVMEEIANDKKKTKDLAIETKKIVVEERVNEKYPRRKIEKDENTILGRVIKEDAMSITDIVGEENNIVIEGYVFGTDIFESSKSNFKIITLKVTDYTDSIYVKVFVREDDDFASLVKQLKEGKWLKIRGYTKNDVYSKELVLNARDINIINKKDDEIIDDAEEKRVELHAHTMMSQMDGVIDANKLVNKARSWGHKAIAITDHNGGQAFPVVYRLIKSINKGLKEGEEPFKAIYGTELTLIEDDVNIVVRPTDNKLLDSTYVVFDFETTGFNAGGKDSIIEIGAVKICNGEIIDTYDELINPGVKLEQKIIDITNITDEMLEGKDNEENAIKRFIKLYVDLTMVAHNSKFDVSFLEMS